MSASRLPTARHPSSAETRRVRVAAQPRLVLGRYRLEQRLGAGAFGTVWSARDERLGREVAVKIVSRERIVGGRFEREARAAARLAHPAIVTLYEAAVDDDGAYLVSELVHGGTLADLLDQGILSDRDVVAIALALCDALSHAHAQGVVHRDVKPSNILIPERPTSALHPAKLTDFGVARVIGGDSLTRAGDVVGTAAYMAPEQAEGREAGPAADLYALALVVYEALTGVNPLRTGTAATRARRLGAYLPPLRRQRRDLPRELGRVIDLALRPRPRERGSLEELRACLVAAIADVQDVPGVVGPSWRAPRTGSGLGHSPAQDGGPGPVSFREPAAEPPGRGNPDLGRDAENCDPAPAPWLSRGLGAAGTAAAGWWLAAHLLASPPIAPAAIALLAGVLALAVPRIAWLATIGAIALVATAQGRAGGALILLGAGLLPVALLFRSGCSWSLPAGAPALGLIGLAGAWPALAARGRTIWRRAALGAIGWIWLAVAAPLAGADLYTARVPGTPAPSTWTASLHATLHDVLAPLLASGVLAAAPVWAAAAVVLPWLVTGRSLTRDLVRVTVWSAIAVSGTEALAGIGHGAGGLAAPATAVIGAVAGGLIGVAPVLCRAWRPRPHATSSPAQLP